jgi:hypothetical protein
MRASTRHGLQAARNLSIEKISRIDMEPIRQIMLAQELDVQPWFEPVCSKLAHQSTPLSLEDARMVGLDITVKTFHLREQDLRYISCRQALPRTTVENDSQIQYVVKGSNRDTTSSQRK